MIYYFALVADSAIALPKTFLRIFDGQLLQCANKGIIVFNRFIQQAASAQMY
jgi:hypothetical protein